MFFGKFANTLYNIRCYGLVTKRQSYSADDQRRTCHWNNAKINRKYKVHSRWDLITSSHFFKLFRFKIRTLSLSLRYYHIFEIQESVSKFDDFWKGQNGWWRQNVLVTTLRYWLRFWPFWSPTSTNFLN